MTPKDETAAAEAIEAPFRTVSPVADGRIARPRGSAYSSSSSVGSSSEVAAVFDSGVPPSCP